MSAGKIVLLRDEHEVRVRRGFIGDQQVSLDPSDMKLNTEIVTERCRYQPRPPDHELSEIITSASEEPLKTLRGWYGVAQSRMSGHGVRLIPEQIQVLLDLDLRQLYLDSQEGLWTIEGPFSTDEHGRLWGIVTQKLL